MKNIRFTSRKTDLKVLAVIGLSGIAGLLLPQQFEGSINAQGFDFIFAIPLALLVWCVFHLIEPSGHGWKWTVAEFTVVPIVWALLMLSLAMWFHHLWWPIDTRWDTL